MRANPASCGSSAGRRRPRLRRNPGPQAIRRFVGHFQRGPTQGIEDQGRQKGVSGPDRVNHVNGKAGMFMDSVPGQENTPQLLPG